MYRNFTHRFFRSKQQSFIDGFLQWTLKMKRSLQKCQGFFVLALKISLAREIKVSLNFEDAPI